MKIKIPKSLHKLKRTIVKHSPEILTGIGIFGMITSTVLAVKATPKALELIEEEKEEQDVEKLSVKDTIKTTWKCYIPTAISTVSSAACVILANSIHLKRNTILATAYKLSESAFLEYKDKVIEKIGKEQEAEIEREVRKSHADKAERSSEVDSISSQIFTFKEPNSGRYFQSSFSKIRKIVSELNEEIAKMNYISLNDFYYELGLDNTTDGYEKGWNIWNGWLQVHFESVINDNDELYIQMRYETPPYNNYDEL